MIKVYAKKMIWVSDFLFVGIFRYMKEAQRTREGKND